MNTHVPPPKDAKGQPGKPRAGDAQPGTPAFKSKPAHPLAGPRTSWTWQGLVIAGVIVIAGLGAYLWWPASSDSKVGYSLAKASYADVVVGVHAPAIIEARGTIDIVAQTGGRIQSIAVKSGDHVSKGQILARLTSESAREELIGAQTELASRRADLARAEADAGEARAAAARLRDAMKPGAFEGAEARMARAAATAEESRALLKSGETNFAEARAAVASLEVRAPFDGLVLKLDLDAGQRTITRGQPILTMVRDLSQLNLRAAFSENALGMLRTGERAEFTTPAFPRRSFPAMLTALELWPKRQTVENKEVVTYPATLTAVNPGEALRPGMSAEVSIVTAEAKNVLVVPNTALAFTPLPKVESRFPPLRPSRTGPRIGRVWVMQSDVIKPRDVALGLSDGRMTQVVSGPLRAGDIVITGALVATDNSSS
jgi:HlyD family secretion protein